MWLSSEYSIWPRATALLLLLPPPPGSKLDHSGPRRPALCPIYLRRRWEGRQQHARYVCWYVCRGGGQDTGVGVPGEGEDEGGGVCFPRPPLPPSLFLSQGAGKGSRAEMQKGEGKGREKGRRRLEKQSSRCRVPRFAMYVCMHARMHAFTHVSRLGHTRNGRRPRGE